MPMKGTILVGTIGQGVMMSPDDGESWTRASVRQGMHSDAIVKTLHSDPRRPEVVHAGSDMGLCVNARAVDVLRDSSFTGEIRELFYGINDDLFQPVPRGRARAALEIPEDVDLFLYAGRLLELKGVQDLIAAFARLRSERPERTMKLLVVGDGEYREADDPLAP